jgi:hypothetical protein
MNVKTCLFAFLFFEASFAWTQKELDVYDLVEEVGQNFYSFLDIEQVDRFGLRSYRQSASDSEIRKAFRGKSLIYHPDKSDDADAETKFRHLVVLLYQADLEGCHYRCVERL